MGDAYYIVENLNAAPYGLSLDLLAFSEKAPHQLIEILGLVCGTISPKHARPEGAPEALEGALERVFAFLRVVKYKPPMDAGVFRQLLAAGDREAVHPLLRWLLAQGPLLQKRAFVGYHLTLPEMPDDLAYDPAVADLKSAIKALQPEFVEAHKAAEAARGAAGAMPALRSRIKQLEEEKERLAEKVERARSQVASLPHAGSYTELCTALRRQHDEEVSISATLQAQAAGHERAEAAHARAAARLGKAGGGGGGADGNDLLAALKEDVAKLRRQVDEVQPREIEARQRRLTALQDALSIEVGGEAGLQRLAAQAAALQQSAAEASARLAAAERARQSDRAFLQVRQAQQMVAVSAKRRGELEARLERLARSRDALTAALGVHDNGGAAGGGGGGGVSDAEWKAKYDAIKGRLAQFKAMKKELSALEAEAFVLARTKAVLDAQGGGAVTDAHQQQGSTHGSPGRPAAQAMPAAAPAAHGPARPPRQEDLESLRAAIAANKAELAPQVQQLRAARERFQALESRLSAAREAHDSAVGPLEARCSELESEVAKLEHGVEEGRAALAAAGVALSELEDGLARLAAEPGGAEALLQRAEAQAKASEAELRRQREQQRAAAAAAAGAAAQQAVLQDLARVLEAKLAAAAAGGGGDGGGGGAAAAGPANVESFSTANANVAVF